MSSSSSVLIFGPGKHFGLQLAKRFGSEGHHVVLVARDEILLSGLCDQLKNDGISCSYVGADVGSSRELAQSLNALGQSIPRVSTLIFNVKVSAPGSGLAISPELLTQALAINVSGALAALQASMPLFSANASIILTGGGYKDAPDLEKLALSVSKGALHTLFLALVEPMQQRGLRISTVVIDGVVRESGPILPDRVANAFWEAGSAKSGTIVRVA